MNERIQRNAAAAIPGISDSVKVTAGELLFLSGVVGLEEDGAAPTELARAAELTFRSLERALAAGGATLPDLVRVNVYIEQLDDEKLQIYRRVRDKILDPKHLPASTVIGVQSLFRGAPIEIDAIAAI